VLFSGDAAMLEFLVGHVSEALVTLDPRDALLTGFREFASQFKRDRREHVLRRSVLDQNPRLRGRQLLKQERWGESLVSLLEDRGVDLLPARVAVGEAALVLSISYDTWSRGHVVDRNRSRV